MYNNSININGSIGYTLLKNGNNNILILADMHDILPYCDKNMTSVFVSDWLKTKKNSIILLEEVPRYNVTLKELWPSSPHTQKLKDIYLAKDTTIIGIDPRPFMIPYSAELLLEGNNTNNDDFPTGDDTLKEHCDEFRNFYSLSHKFFIESLPDIYNMNYLLSSPLGKHYLDLKYSIKQFIKNNNMLKNKKMKHIVKDNHNIITKINYHISDVMEWYIIAKIFQNLEKGKTNFIVHAGLAHTTNIIRLLQNYYGFSIASENGITNMNKSHIKYNGCLKIPDKVNNLFGGFGYTNWL